MDISQLTLQELTTEINTVREHIMEDPANKAFTDLGWTPIFMAYPEAKIVVIGPAPGIKTQEKRDVFRDKSGDRLREWMGVDEDTFYHSRHIAVLPLDFYFPGKAKTGDLPPRLEFAKKWHPQLLQLMPNVELIILMGLYSQKFYLQSRYKGNLTKTVFAYEEFLPAFFPVVHASPLNFRWFNKHPEFELEVVPKLRATVQNILTKD